MTLTINPLGIGINGTTGVLDTASIAWATGDLIVLAYEVTTTSNTATQAPTVSAVSGFTLGTPVVIPGGWDNSGLTRRGLYLIHVEVTAGGTGVLRTTPNGTNITHQRVTVNKYDAGEWDAVVQSKATAVGLTGTGAQSITLDSSPAATSSVFGAIAKANSATVITAGSNYTLVDADADVNTDNSDAATQEGAGASTGTTFGFNVGGTNAEYSAVAIEVSESGAPATIVEEESEFQLGKAKTTPPYGFVIALPYTWDSDERIPSSTMVAEEYISMANNRGSIVQWAFSKLKVQFSEGFELLPPVVPGTGASTLLLLGAAHKGGWRKRRS